MDIYMQKRSFDCTLTPYHLSFYDIHGKESELY